MHKYSDDAAMAEVHGTKKIVANARIQRIDFVMSVSSSASAARSYAERNPVDGRLFQEAHRFRYASFRGHRAARSRLNAVVQLLTSARKGTESGSRSR